MKDPKSPKFVIPVTPLLRAEAEFPNKDLNIEAEKPVFMSKSENPDKGTAFILAKFIKANKAVRIDLRDLVARVKDNAALLAQTFDEATNTYVGNVKIGYNQGRIIVQAE